MKRQDKQCRTGGFTLIELSIVMVIIGLVIGGILVGRDLIRAAELRRIYTEKESIVTAVFTFRNKYACLAGDCNVATDLFGTDGEGCGVITPKSPKQATCNGNGNAIIDDVHEHTLFWQHLASAGFIPGLYSGTEYSDSPQEAFPPVSVERAFAWKVYNNIFYDDMRPHPSSIFTKNIMLIMWYDFDVPFPGKALLTPTDASSFDIKYDDGSPITGGIQAMSTIYVTACLNGTAYDTTQTERNCNPVFNNPGF